MLKKIYIIAGPTASGKTSLSIDLARRLNGQIINADSIQVYQDVPLLTARPSEDQTNEIPHHLFGYLDAFANNSVQDWLNRIPELIEKIDVPIFVGGTGLYIKSLTEGLSPIPDIPEEIRQEVRQMSMEELKSSTPDIQFTDPQRLMRALEVFKTTGKTIQWWYEQPKKMILNNVEFTKIILLPSREKLYTQCNYRFNQMIQDGALKQVIELIEKNPKMTGGVFQAIGVLDLISFLKGEKTLKSAVEHAQQLTRNYAKRQITWFKHQINADILLQTPVLPEKI